jgi:hypothetical protein
VLEEQVEDKMFLFIFRNRFKAWVKDSKNSEWKKRYLKRLIHQMNLMKEVHQETRRELSEFK